MAADQGAGRGAAESPGWGPTSSRQDARRSPNGAAASPLGTDGHGAGEMPASGRTGVAERYAPFEGAGAISTWQLSLPAELRRFHYGTISDAVLHLNYTARPGVRRDAVVADLRERFASAADRTLARSVSL